MVSVKSLNKELQAMGLDSIVDVDKFPYRTRYIAHLSAQDWNDKDWVKKLRVVRQEYVDTFHDYFAHVHPFLRYEIGEEKVYWDYNEDTGVYDELSGSTAREYVISLLIKEGLRDTATEAYARNCLARYRAVYTDRGNRYDAFDKDGDWFHAGNCWVHLVKLTTEPHTPKRLSRKVSAVAYDATAVCPTYDKFLDTDVQLKKDQVRVIDQYSGLILTSDVIYGKMLTIIGKPGSGKSTLLDTWSYILGDHVTQKRLTDLAGDGFRFAGGDLVGKSLLWFDEVDVKRSDLGNNLGNLITGKKIRVERKGINGILQVNNTVKCVLTANNLPMSSEHGMYRRLIHIPFERSFYDDGTQINNIFDTMCTEGSGILNRMLTGLHDIRKMHGFTVIEGHEESIEEYKMSSDVIAEFLGTFFEPAGDDDTVETKDIFEAYVHFVGDKTGMLLTPQRFGRMLASQPLMRFQRIKPVRKTTSRKWSGLRLQEGYSWENTGVKSYIIKNSKTDGEDW